MKFILRNLVAALPLMFISCLNNETEVLFNATVITNQSTVVGNAEIYVADKLIGKTNSQGVFSKKIKLEKEKNYTIEVKKEDSKEYYFAPFYKEVSISDKDSSSLSVTATMFFVPKPVANKTKEIIANTKETVTHIEAKDDKTKGNIIHSEKSEEDEALTTNTKSKPKTLVASKNKSKDFKKIIVKKAVIEKSIFTVHVTSAKDKLANAQIYVASEDDKIYKKVCITNQRGRCAFKTKIIDNNIKKVKLLAKKTGFISRFKVVSLDKKGVTKINLFKGKTLDIFAFQKNYNIKKGLKNIAVLINNKLEGYTDAYGFYSYVYKGKTNELLSVVLKTKKHLPEIYESDYIASSDMTLTKNFTPKRLPKLKVSILPTKINGGFDNKSIDSKFIRNNIIDVIDKHILSTEPYKKVSYKKISNLAKKNNTTVMQLYKKGWKSRKLNDQVDLFIKPLLILTPKASLEISLIGSNGKVISAIKGDLKNLNNYDRFDDLIYKFSKSILDVIPYEGAILKNKSGEITLNMGFSSGTAIKKDQEIEIYGTASDKMGLKKEFTNIATANVVKVFDKYSIARVSSQIDRSMISRGDLFNLRNIVNKKTKKYSPAMISIVSGKKKITKLADVNIYANNKWIGTTDKHGRLYTSLKSLVKIKAVKFGYFTREKSIDFSTSKNHMISITPQNALLEISSIPSKAKIYIDDDYVGLTPFKGRIKTTSGFVKLKLVKDKSYKIYTRLIEIKNQNIVYTKDKSIKLEKDFLSKANELVRNGKFKSAISILKKLKKPHSDYFSANQTIGEIYLSNLNKPAKAAAAFANITHDATVKNLNNKKYIATFVNEAISLYMTGERLQSKNKKVAIAHFLAAIKVFTKVEPQLRFINKENYSRAKQNVLYYKALSSQKIWNISKDKRILTETIALWRRYLNSTIVNDSFKSFRESAKVYFKQVLAYKKSVNRVSM